MFRGRVKALQRDRGFGFIKSEHGEDYFFHARGNTYTVDLTNLDTGVRTRTTTFQNTDADRGVARENGQPAGYVGLQSYPGFPIAFRHIQIKT